MRGDATKIKSLVCTQLEAKHFLAHQPLEDQHYCIRFDVSHALGIG